MMATCLTTDCHQELNESSYKHIIYPKKNYDLLERIYFFNVNCRKLTVNFS